MHPLAPLSSRHWVGIGVVMPKGPNGQRRPADVIRNIVQVMRIATGEEQEAAPVPKNAAAVELGRKGGLKGGKARAAKLTSAQRSAAASKAVKARWKKTRKKSKA